MAPLRADTDAPGEVDPAAEADLDAEVADEFDPPLRTTSDGELRKDPDPATALTVPEAPEPGRMPPLDMAALEKSGLVVGHKVRTRISEEFRITVGHLLRSMQGGRLPQPRPRRRT